MSDYTSPTDAETNLKVLDSASLQDKANSTGKWGVHYHPLPSSGWNHEVWWFRDLSGAEYAMNSFGQDATLVSPKQASVMDAIVAEPVKEIPVVNIWMDEVPEGSCGIKVKCSTGYTVAPFWGITSDEQLAGGVQHFMDLAYTLHQEGDQWNVCVIRAKNKNWAAIVVIDTEFEPIVWVTFDGNELKAPLGFSVELEPAVLSYETNPNSVRKMVEVASWGDRVAGATALGLAIAGAVVCIGYVGWAFLMWILWAMR